MRVYADDPAGATNEEAAAIPRHEVPTSGRRLIQVVPDNLAGRRRTTATSGEYILPHGARESGAFLEVKCVPYSHAHLAVGGALARPATTLADQGGDYVTRIA